MSRFENKLCPVCRQPFKDGDDIVVCPVCGTPHHRACYLEHNECGVKEYHDKGFVWNGRLPDEPEEEKPEVQEEAVEPSSDNTETHSAGFPQGTPMSDQESMFEELQQQDPHFREILNSIRDDKPGEDGVSMRELTCYTASSVAHYGPAFNAFRGTIDGKKHKVYFNFCSGLFAPVFQFYRKMDVFGLLLIVVMLIPSLIMMAFSGMSNSALIVFTYVFNMINLAETVLLCFFGDYIYYKHCVRNILKIRREFGDKANTDDYYAELCERGRPSALRAVVGFLIMSLAVAVIWVLQNNMI